MTLLSTRAKEAIKTALAMAIAYGIALSMDWDRPYWAGFAVAMISLPTAGMSLNKGALRMLGTLVAGAAALTFIALFSQERWWFLVVISLYVGVCAYMMAGKKHKYFYQVCAFVCVIIAFDGGVNSENAFQTAVTRVQQTGMGILVYTLVAVFLWPQSSRAALDEACRKLSAAQRRLYETYRGLLAGQGAAEDSHPVRMQEVQLLTKLGQALEAAETDTYEVWELRHQWRRFQRQSTELRETLERWRQSFPEIQPLDPTRLLPDLEAVCSEVGLRLAQIERMLAGEEPDRMPQAIALAIDKAELRNLPHFQKAAIAVTKAQLDRLEALTRSQFDCVRDIKGYAPQAATPPREEAQPTGLAFDLDRFGVAIRVVAGLWLAFLVWVYIDPPGHSGFVTMAVSLGLGFALFPQLRVSTTFLPAALSCAFGGVLYIFVMPHLSGYAQLGLMMFGATFAINYLLAAPRQALARLLGLAMFLAITSIDNQQTYSFSVFASTTAMVILIIALLVVTSYVPTSPRPEKAFLRLLARYFRHAEFLISRLALDRDQGRGLAARWKTALYRNDLLELPAKLAVWGQHIDYRTCPDNAPEQVQTLVANLQALAYRIKELAEVRELPQAESLVRQFHDDLRAWRQTAQEQLRLWADDTEKAVAPGVDMEERLAARMARLDARMEETQRQAEAGALSERDYENFFRYLGGLRGLSETGIGFIRLAETVDWARWREARF
ncbi:MAG: FUSC family protein [Rhodospirillales bacterium]|nr:FUSC family protein [Rhodospirillales bacterium]MDH3790119.1 FUSC family protein [Rhodospirillales bacterium]